MNRHKVDKVFKFKRCISALVLMSALCLLTLPVHATLITAQLTGDPRLENPDNLIVDVSIDFNGSTADWKIDINSPLHPNIKLDEFYFNVVGPATLYTFSNFNPTGWGISTPATVQGAGGNTGFLFEARDPAPIATNVTNSQNLTFT